MPVQNTILNFKCFNQLKNGKDFDSNPADFANNLVGNVGEFVKISFDQQITWFAVASGVDTWTFIDDASDFTIERVSGNWFADGFEVGQTFEYYAIWTARTGAETFIADIDSISEDGKTLQYTKTSGTTPTSATTTTVGGTWANPNLVNNQRNASIFKFGLIGNDEDFNTVSKVSGNDQGFQVGKMTRSVGTPKPYVFQGVFKDWLSGLADIQLVTFNIPKNNDLFRIQHAFEILPDYLEGQLANLQNAEPPDLYKGNDTLKYVFTHQLRKGLSDVNSSLDIQKEDLLGSVGWFNENFNGGVVDYALKSISYGIVSSIDLEATTTIIIIIEKLSGNFLTGQRSGVYHSFLPPNESDYTDLKTDIQTNFVKDSIFHGVGDASGVGTNIFKTIDTVIDGNFDLVITLTLAFSAAQQQKLLNNDDYRLSVAVEDGTLTAANSDRVMLLVDVNKYIKLNSSNAANLINVTKFNLLRHDEVLGVDVGSVIETAWNEDGILLDYAFDLDINKAALLNGLSFNLVANNGADFFLLDQTVLNLSGVVVSSGVQQLEIDTSRGYLLPDGSQFNFVKITTGSEAAGIVSYSGSFGQKIKWQDWLKNLQTDPVFFDVSKLNNNLNFKSSEYSGIKSYNIFILMEADLSGVDDFGSIITPTLQEPSGIITVLDYETADTGDWTDADVVLLHPDTLADIGNQILKNKNTLLQITWTNPADPDVGDIDYIIHRIQPNKSLGDNIEESSSLNGVVTGGLLLPTTFAKVGATIVSQSLINFTRLNPDICYDVSGRIESISGFFGEWVGGVCEVDAIIIDVPDPIPPAVILPKFCGKFIQSNGANIIFDKKFKVTYDGIFSFLLIAFSLEDKGELFVNNIRVATTGDADNNDGTGVDGFDPETGIGTADGDINLLSFNNKNERTLLESGKTFNNNWYINKNRPIRKSQFEADTGFEWNNKVSQGNATGQITWASVKTGDEVFVRITGGNIGGTQWNFTPFCFR